MTFAPPAIPEARIRAKSRRTAAWAAAVACLALLPCVATAAPFIWDQDSDRIDDRIETVHLLGYSYSFVNADTLAQQRIQVIQQPTGLVYGVYVVFDHAPTPLDLTSLALAGMPILTRYENTAAVRSLGGFSQIQAAAALAGVERVEAVPLFYPEVRDGAASIGVRDLSQQVFPTWQGSGGQDGSGVVIAFLDTGINDAADGPYPGHESLSGRFAGGASFLTGDSLLDTPRAGSVNPADHGGVVTQSHGTHVAGIALGSGGAAAYAVGVAPGARFVDVKVLSDAGSGTGVAEGLDWCIHNRARDWGGGVHGIQVVNLSLSSPDASDGTDVTCRLADRAVDLGMVVMAAMGNAGHDHLVPSPAGASHVLAIGAMDDQRTGRPEDDTWAAFDNYGPRASNGDSNPLDEQKPDLLAPGVAVLSADGSLSSDGTHYQRLSGTSMAAAFASGAAALLLSASPGLTPDGVATLLHGTARRDLAGLPSGTTGADPRWRSTAGYGVVDLYAARLELLQPGNSQIVQLELTASPLSIDAVLRTQRERGALWFVFERAPDVGNLPGAFAAIDSVPAAGDSSLAGLVNRHAYARSWAVPEIERGQSYWYRVACTEGGVRINSPARRFTSPIGPSAATIALTIVHDAYDHDVTGAVSGSGPGGEFSLPLPGTTAAVSSDWVTGESTTGTVAWTFHIEVPEGTGDKPSASAPWALRVDEGGYVNRSGRITDFEVIWHGAGGDEIIAGGPVPLPTLEGTSVYAAAPAATLGVGGPTASAVPRFGPNPVVAGSTVQFALPGPAPAHLDVFDLQGRRIARVPFRASPSGSLASWTTRDASGRILPAGVYVCRYGARAALRLVVVGR